MYVTIPQTLSSVRFMLIPGSAPRTITVAVMVEMYDVHAVFCADCEQCVCTGCRPTGDGVTGSLTCQYNALMIGTWDSRWVWGSHCYWWSCAFHSFQSSSSSDTDTGFGQQMSRVG